MTKVAFGGGLGGSLLAKIALPNKAAVKGDTVSKSSKLPKPKKSTKPVIPAPKKARPVTAAKKKEPKQPEVKDVDY